MNGEDKAYLLESYRKTLEVHGDTPEAVQWTQASQRYRFKVLTEIANLESERVLDYGCGKGDLYEYLHDAGFRGSYTGLDINLDLIRSAKTKFPCVRFELCDIEEQPVSESFDYVLISGVFNNRISDNWSTMTALLKKAYELAGKGLAFNAISTYVNYQERTMSYASPEETFRFCMTNLSRCATLRHDNVPFNFAVYVYRKRDWKK